MAEAAPPMWLLLLEVFGGPWIATSSEMGAESPLFCSEVHSSLNGGAGSRDAQCISANKWSLKSGPLGPPGGACDKRSVPQPTLLSESLEGLSAAKLNPLQAPQAFPVPSEA